MDKKIKIIIAEDHAVMRSALKGLIHTSPGLEVVAEAGNGKELLELLKRIHADIVLLDIEMPVMNGMEALRKIVKHYPDVKVIMLSMYNDHGTRAHFISEGARAFIPKAFSEEQFFKVLRSVLAKGIYVEEEITLAIIRYKATGNLETAYRYALSQRELDVLAAIANGLTDTQIAAGLGLSRHTVHSHRNNLLKKTYTRNAAELVHYALKNKLIE